MNNRTTFSSATSPNALSGPALFTKLKATSQAEPGESIWSHNFINSRWHEYDVNACVHRSTRCCHVCHACRFARTELRVSPPLVSFKESVVHPAEVPEGSAEGTSCMHVCGSLEHVSESLRCSFAVGPTQKTIPEHMNCLNTMQTQ